MLDVITALPLSHTTRVVWLSAKAVMTSSKSEACSLVGFWCLVFAAKHSPPLGYAARHIVLDVLCRVLNHGSRCIMSCVESCRVLKQRCQTSHTFSFRAALSPASYMLWSNGLR